VGIYLGQSPQHVRTVALVLSLTTGLTSPQFHVKFDPTIQTMRKRFSSQPASSLWQAKCGFVNELDDPKLPVVPPEGATAAAAQAAKTSERSSFEDNATVQFREEATQSLPPSEGDAEPCIETPAVLQQPPVQQAQRQSTRRSKPPERLNELREVGNTMLLLKLSPNPTNRLEITHCWIQAESDRQMRLLSREKRLCLVY
jgi:hypothetical protein